MLRRIALHECRDAANGLLTAMGGSSAVFVLLGGVHAPLVDAGLITTPYMISFALLAMVMALSYELVSEAVLASRYAREIEAGNRWWQSLLSKVRLSVIGVDAEGRISCRSGEKRTLRLSSVELESPEGRHEGVLHIGEDIKDRLEAQRDLTVARREMERLMRASLLGELASSLAHELNQPLAAILSNAQAAQRMLSSNALQPRELGDILDDIVRDDRRASEVINRIRGMVRKQEVRRERASAGRC